MIETEIKKIIDEFGDKLFPEEVHYSKAINEIKKLVKEYTCFKVTFDLSVEEMPQGLSGVTKENVEIFAKTKDEAFDILFKKFPNAKYVMI